MGELCACARDGLSSPAKPCRAAGINATRRKLGVGHDSGHWDLGAVLGYHSGWPTTGLTLEESPAGETTAVIGRRNALRLGGFASLDLRASRSVPLRVGALDVFFEMSNATNRDNPCCVDFDLEEDVERRIPRAGDGHVAAAARDVRRPLAVLIAARPVFALASSNAQ